METESAVLLGDVTRNQWVENIKNNSSSNCWPQESSNQGIRWNLRSKGNNPDVTSNMMEPEPKPSRKIESYLRKEVKRLEKGLKKAINDKEFWRNKYFSERKKYIFDASVKGTIVKTVRNTLKGGKKEIVKKLEILEEVVQNCTKFKSDIKSHKEKTLFSKVMVQIDPSNNLNSITTRLRTKCLRDQKPTKNAITKLRQAKIELEEKVIAFFNDDLNTTQAPGIKDTITRNKIKYRKRFLREPVYVLHRKFCRETGLEISRASFYRLKPAYVLQQKVEGRDTCLCKKHSNFKFMLSKLHQHKIVDTESSTEFLESICCDFSEKACAFDECSNCSNNKLELGPDDNGDEIIKYYQWTREKVQKQGAKDLKFTSTDPVRTEKTSSLAELVKDFN